MITLTPIRLALCLALLALLVSTPTLAADPPVRKVTVVGSATIKVVPDEMRWTVQVSINDATLAKAKARHDASLDAALKYLKGLGDALKDLQTGGIRIDKNLYPGDNAEARKNPFSCATQFTFILTDMNQYGPICDALAKLDGIQVQGGDYASSKEDATKREALKKALQNAHDKASDLAATAGLNIDKPLEVVEGGNDSPRPMMMRASLYSAQGGGTPEAVPGQIEINATVTATYDLVAQ